MPEVILRKQVVIVETEFHEGGPPPDTPVLKAACLAVLANPFAGTFAAGEQVQTFMEDLKPLGLAMTDELIDALGGDPARIEGYGKGAIIGEAGELEHGAMWHVPGGYAMRERLGEAKAIVPSAKKVGGLGCRIDIPITHINASYVRSHFSAMEVGVSDGPRAGELLFALVMTTGGRIHPRMGGLTVDEIKGEDGLR